MGTERIGKYDLLEYLGGGMARVYRARDSTIGRIVCLKVLAEGADADSKARFLQEARVAGNLSHDNVVRVYDFGQDSTGRPYMIMEFLDGEDLRALIKSGRTGDLAWKLKAALQIARALAHVHAAGIIHRDIKPENIHVTPSGLVKLMDFGIAKSQDVSLTKTGYALGTPYYMSPEQVRGQTPAPQMDIYAFGVMLVELLTGVRPTEGDTIDAIFYKVLYQELDLSPLEAVQAPAAIRELAVRCCSKDPARRPQSFTEVCAVLEQVLGDAAPRIENAAPPPALAAFAAGAATAPSVPAGPAAETPPTASEEKRRNRRRLVLALAPLAAAGVIAAAVLYFRPAPEPRPPVVNPPAEVKPPQRISTTTGEMVLVPAGAFRMGKDGVEATSPAYYVDVTEVTNTQYARFCAERGRPLPEGFRTDEPQLPAVGMTYVDAQEFARWAGKRLPTMIEWEKAARGTDGRLYPWGNDADAGKAVVERKSLAPVGSIPAGASPWGALDMAGNALEFVDDLRTPSAAALNSFARLVQPPPTADEPWYAIRGGSFHTPLTADVLWESVSVPARFRESNIGFRCVREVRQ